VDTSNATNKVTAVCEDETAVIAIYLNNTAVTGELIENGTSVSWTVGQNILTIIVTAESGEPVTYLVTVNKS